MSTPNKPTAVPKKEGTLAGCQAHPAHLEAKTRGSVSWGLPATLGRTDQLHTPRALCSLQKPSARPSVQQTCLVTAQQAGNQEQNKTLNTSPSET